MYFVLVTIVFQNTMIMTSLRDDHFYKFSLLTTPLSSVELLGGMVENKTSIELSMMDSTE